MAWITHHRNQHHCGCQHLLASVWLIVQQQQFVTLQRPWQSCNKGALAGDGYQSKCASLYVWKVNMRVLMSVEFECVGVWVNKSVGARALVVARKSLSVYVRASMKESKRHSQGAVRGEPGCRLITGLRCVWCLPGTDSFSPHGSPFFSPLLYTTLFLYTIPFYPFHTQYLLRLSPHHAEREGGVRGSTLALSWDCLRKHGEFQNKALFCRKDTPESGSLTWQAAISPKMTFWMTFNQASWQRGWRQLTFVLKMDECVDIHNCI